MASTALPQKPQPTRMRAETRRNQIVAVAAELFASRGFSGTTTKEIAEGAGVSEAVIFRHFASKEQLYAAILDYKVKQGTERLKAQMEEAASRKDDRAFRSIDPAVAARAFVGMVLHQVQARTIFKDDDVKLSNRQIADRFVEIFLNGVRD